MNRAIPTHDPVRRQRRADGARLEASQATDPEIKTVLLEIALAYERLTQIVAKAQHERFALVRRLRARRFLLSQLRGFCRAIQRTRVRVRAGDAFPSAPRGNHQARNDDTQQYSSRTRRKSCCVRNATPGDAWDSRAVGLLPSGEPGVAISAIWAFMIIDPSPNLLYSGVPNRTSTLTLAAKRAFHFPRGTDVVLKFA